MGFFSIFLVYGTRIQLYHILTTIRFGIEESRFTNTKPLYGQMVRDSDKVNRFISSNDTFNNVSFFDVKLNKTCNY